MKKIALLLALLSSGATICNRPAHAGYTLWQCESNPLGVAYLKDYRPVDANGQPHREWKGNLQLSPGVDGSIILYFSTGSSLEFDRDTGDYRRVTNSGHAICNPIADSPRIEN
jgi:hypothetical protein